MRIHTILLGLAAALAANPAGARTPDEPVLRLRYANFDPLARVPAVARELAAAPASELFVVQFDCPGANPRRALAERGIEMLLFLPEQAAVVRMPTERTGEVGALPYVRWVGPFHPAYKLEEGLLEPRSWTHRARRVNLVTFERGAAGQGPVADLVGAVGGVVNERTSSERMSATLTRAQLLVVARSDDVQWIDAWGAPEADMDIARAFHGADFAEAVGGYTGAGIQVESFDLGCEETHPELQNFILHTQNTPSLHGTATAGILCSTGTVNPQGRGVLPDALLVIADVNFVTDRYQHTAELQLPPYECVLQSTSWGSPRTTLYTAISHEMDRILFDFPRISILQTFGNSGMPEGRPEAWAKNVITVGGILHRNTLTIADDCWCFGASTGPAADGRVKPDAASFYDDVTTLAQGGGTATFGGTSASTPIVAGHVGLLYEMFADGIWSDPPPGTTVFEARPFNTTVKALVVNTARQWPFSGLSHDLGRFKQGWGAIDVRAALELEGRVFVVDEEEVLQQSETARYRLVVPFDEPSFRATLVYRDLPGTLSSTVHRINDLDLFVTAPDGTTYWGNNGLLEGLWSTPGGAPNAIDTVENVFVPAPQAGTWTVEVIAREVNGDAHVETIEDDVDFALVVSGVDPDAVGYRYCFAPINSTGQTARIDARGSSLIADDDLTLVATRVPPNQFGVLLASRTQGFIPGPMLVLCLNTPIARFATQVTSSGPVGVLQVPVDLGAIPMTPPVPVLSGESWYFQFWFRDASPALTSNLSDAYCITFE